jgi:hypothetical protein
MAHGGGRVFRGCDDRGMVRYPDACCYALVYVRYFLGCCVGADRDNVGGLTLVTYVVGTTGRKLVYSMPTATPLLATPPGISSDIEVRHGGGVLVNPQVLEVRLQSRGRRDIRRDDFEGGKPLELDVGIPVVSLLDWFMGPGGDSTDPDVRVRGLALAIGPSLIPRRQVFTFHLLADGGETLPDLL